LPSLSMVCGGGFECRSTRPAGGDRDLKGGDRNGAQNKATRLCLAGWLLANKSPKAEEHVRQQAALQVQVG
jgi:hypothetical protein